MTVHTPPVAERTRTQRALAPEAETGRVRIVTYNVRRCFGLDGQYAPSRIAQVLVESGAQVIALQELDLNRRRSGAIDQALEIATALGMQHHFHPAMTVAEEHYGDAILSALPLRLVKAAALPGPLARPWVEPRGALWVEITLGSSRLQVINTHFGLGGRERRLQAEALLGPDWLGHPEAQGPLVLVGDFNAVPLSRSYRLLASRLKDAHRTAGPRPRPTFPSRFPVLRIDHVFVSPELKVQDVGIVRTPRTRVASDHLPLFADLEVEHAA